ncbi:ATP phosphoribosyltransferase regulatory subunit [Lacibacterium aquatile]|uniref:ATP phosphoribosyltransferase regulatory subunit n=1 Tax=Lacibacterium aquatile TaxID=1168082 RepID=A0ABW5DTX0_9PROT
MVWSCNAGRTKVRTGVVVFSALKDQATVALPADTDYARRALLPAGLRDELPPEAEHRAHCIDTLLRSFAGEGYERVDPPLVEFEDSLLNGADASVAAQTFRLMDPVSQRMLAVRPDVTVQIARIATTRLGGRPRPLRLAYAGSVLRVRGDQLNPERQLTQVGAELIGPDLVTADVEVIRIAIEALRALGLKGLSVDLNLAPLVPAVLDQYGIHGDARSELRAALDRKDAAAVAALAGPAGETLAGLLAATGPARAALMLLTSLELPAAVAPYREKLKAIVQAILDEVPDIGLTLDPVEHRGFEYYTGVGFSLFATGVRGELGRGGRYGVTPMDDEPGQPATGVTLYLDAVMQAAPSAKPRKRLYLPLGTPATIAQWHRSEGWVTVAGLQIDHDPAAEAKRLNCRHVWISDAIVAL